jgi:hypothetical protein
MGGREEGRKGGRKEIEGAVLHYPIYAQIDLRRLHRMRSLRRIDNRI